MVKSIIRMSEAADPILGGRPAHFTVDNPTFSPKVMVFCGLKRDGAFGFKTYENQSMNGQMYHSLLQYTVLPELRIRNGGNLDGLWWQQDGAPCHVTQRNMIYLDHQFQDRVISRRSIRGHDWPARSPDLNPCDYFLWGYLKSRVYTPLPRSMAELKTNIQREISVLDHPMILRSIMDIKARAAKCVIATGGHFE